YRVQRRSRRDLRDLVWTRENLLDLRAPVRRTHRDRGHRPLRLQGQRSAGLLDRLHPYPPAGSVPGRLSVTALGQRRSRPGHDGKAQPGPAAVSGPGRLGAMEAFECGKNSAGKPGPRSATSIVIIPVPFALALTSTTLSAGACRVALSSRCPPLGVTAQTPCD